MKERRFLSEEKDRLPGLMQEIFTGLNKNGLLCRHNFPNAFEILQANAPIQLPNRPQFI